MVDFVMQMTLAEVVADATETDTRFITLACGHVFTVETLDGHVDFSQCYEVTQQGFRVGLKIPDTGAFTARPTCPTCRGPISSPRYNRVIKRALLDVQEQHAIKDASRDVHHARQIIAEIDFDEIKRAVKDTVTSISPPKHKRMPDRAQVNALLRLRPDDRFCIVSDMFTEDLEKLFMISGRLNAGWRKVIDKPLRVYKQLGRIINRKELPHVIAYENAITKLHREEVDLARQRVTSSQSTKNTSEHHLVERAMRVAKMRVGAPFPRGEMRYKIEAIHETIKIRLAIAPIAEEFARLLRIDPASLAATEWNKKHVATNANAVAQKFTIVSATILRSCRRDVDLAANLCKASDAKSLWLSTELLAVQTHFAICRMAASEVIRRKVKESGIRQEQSEWVLEQSKLASERFEGELLAILGDRDGATRNAQLEEMAEETIRPAANVLLDEWHAYAVSLREGVFYSTVSMEEKMQIARAVLEAHHGEFSQVCHPSSLRSGYAGRFYQCPSGHTFTIGEVSQLYVGVILSL